MVVYIFGVWGREGGGILAIKTLVGDFLTLMQTPDFGRSTPMHTLFVLMCIILCIFVCLCEVAYYSHSYMHCVHIIIIIIIIILSYTSVYFFVHGPCFYSIIHLTF